MRWPIEDCLCLFNVVHLPNCLPGSVWTVTFPFMAQWDFMSTSISLPYHNPQKQPAGCGFPCSFILENIPWPAHLVDLVTQVLIKMHFQLRVSAFHVSSGVLSLLGFCQRTSVTFPVYPEGRSYDTPWSTSCISKTLSRRCHPLNEWDILVQYAYQGGPTMEKRRNSSCVADAKEWLASSGLRTSMQRRSWWGQPHYSGRLTISVLCP